MGMVPAHPMLLAVASMSNPRFLQLLERAFSSIKSKHSALSVQTSKKTNKSMVFGPSRINAGVQPLKRKVIPSSRAERIKT